MGEGTSGMKTARQEHKNGVDPKTRKEHIQSRSGLPTPNQENGTLKAAEAQIKGENGDANGAEKTHGSRKRARRCAGRHKGSD